VFQRRRGDVRRIAFVRDLRTQLEDLSEWAEESGIPSREEPSSELDRLAQSNQHEGVVLLTAPRRWLKPKELGALLSERRGVAVALDRVRNPQNIGAVLRSAAFFGIDAALLGAPAPHPGLSPFALRVAEGGAEHLELSRTTDLAETLSGLRARGVRVIGADSHAEAGVAELQPTRPCVLVFGHEREGLGSRIRAQCDQLLEIRGSGAVESLNVGVAAGIFMAALIPRPPTEPRVSGGRPEPKVARRS
jgi:TrmH RNA methyltransferase